MNDFVELHRLINIVLRRWWLLLGLTAIAAMIGYTVSLRQTPVYEAAVTVLVGEITKSTNLSREDIQMSELFAQTYADLAVRQPVLQGVVEMLHLNESWEELRNSVRVQAISGTQLIEIKAEANTPEMARLIADEIANHLILIGPTKVNDGEGNFAQTFILKQMADTQSRILSGQERVKELEATMSGTISSAKFVELQTEKTNQERLIADLVLNYVELSNLSAQDKNSNSLSIIEPAYAEKVPIRPRVNMNILLSGGLGMLLALGIIFLWEFTDDSIKSIDDFSQFEKLNILGTVGKIKGKNYSEKIVTHLASASPTKELYRMICNKICVGSADNPIRSIVVTSPEPAEGKSITAANFGVIMAQANIKTILVDADMRHPVLHQVFDVENKSGLADLLASPVTKMQSILKKTSIDNLQLITSGESSQDQSDLLRSERISQILEYLKGKADLVIIDSPPALLTADAAILSSQADGVIVVIRARKSTRKAIRQTFNELQEANANLLGCIYNQIHKDNRLDIYKRQNQENIKRQHLKASIILKPIRWFKPRPGRRIPGRFRAYKRDQSIEGISNKD